ncbi:MAG: site-specific integrase [Clostridia bacterium]|nr:site-specific integrase [Clostridia bacterium]
MSKKGENIYKRKDGRWEARYIKGYRSDNLPRYGYCYAPSYREVKQKVCAARAAMTSGNSSQTVFKKRRFAYYCDEWLQLNRDRVKESTYVKYCGMVEKHIKPRLGGFLVQGLSSVVIAQFSHDLLCEEELSPKTVKDLLTALRAILNYTGKHFPEPLPPIEIVHPKIPRREMRVLTKEEQRLFVGFLLHDTDEYKFGVLLSLLTGMRIGEICALQWKDVSLSEKTITVRSTMQRLRDLDDAGENKTKVIISEPKSETSARIIPLTEPLTALCRARWCEAPEAFLLTGSRDRYIEPRMMQYKMERFTAECGLEGVHFHTLRHTFATRCVEVDFEIKSLSEILGHSSPRITLERYVHSSMELKRDNMNKLPAIGF